MSMDDQPIVKWWSVDVAGHGNYGLPERIQSVVQATTARGAVLAAVYAVHVPTTEQIYGYGYTVWPPGAARRTITFVFANYFLQTDCETFEQMATEVDAPEGVVPRLA